MRVPRPCRLWPGYASPEGGSPVSRHLRVEVEERMRRHRGSQQRLPSRRRPSTGGSRTGARSRPRPFLLPRSGPGLGLLAGRSHADLKEGSPCRPSRSLQIGCPFPGCLATPSGIGTPGSRAVFPDGEMTVGTSLFSEIILPCWHRQGNWSSDADTPAQLRR